MPSEAFLTPVVALVAGPVAAAWATRMWFLKSTCKDRIDQGCRPKLHPVPVVAPLPALLVLLVVQSRRRTRWRAMMVLAVPLVTLVHIHPALSRLRALRATPR